MRKTGKAPSHRLSRAFSLSPASSLQQKEASAEESLHRQPHASCHCYLIFFFQDELLLYRDVE